MRYSFVLHIYYYVDFCFSFFFWVLVFFDSASTYYNIENFYPSINNRYAFVFNFLTEFVNVEYFLCFFFFGWVLLVLFFHWIFTWILSQKRIHYLLLLPPPHCLPRKSTFYWFQLNTKQAKQRKKVFVEVYRSTLNWIWASSSAVFFFRLNNYCIFEKDTFANGIYLL